MNEIVTDLVLPVLRRSGVHPLLDPDGQFLVVPHETEEGTGLSITVSGNNALREVTFHATITAVPSARLHAVALYLCRLNARTRFASFSLEGTEARLTSCIELSRVPDPDTLIDLGYRRFVNTLDECHAGIERRARLPRRRPRVVREAARIVDELLL
jgi:hypothetical protein